MPSTEALSSDAIVMLGALSALAIFVLFFGWAARRQRRRRLQESHGRAASSHNDSDIGGAPDLQTDDSEKGGATQQDVKAALPNKHLERPDFKEGLAKTRSSLLGRLSGVFSSNALDASVYEELEEILLTADVGVSLSMRWIDALQQAAQKGEVKDGDQAKAFMQKAMLETFAAIDASVDPLVHLGQGPRCLLFVGVNGVGKTTSIGKIGHRLRGQEQSVMMVAGDTFRAAAAEQLEIWSQRAGCSLHRGEEGADPSSVVYKGIEAALAQKTDWILADTAGRLHTKADLMAEIQKTKRSAGKALLGAPHEVWLVVDATTGQNAVQQAQQFHAALGLTGLVLTKLDGTAKGGVVAAIAESVKVPIRFIGVGEKAEDLKPFDAEAFVDAVFAES